MKISLALIVSNEIVGLKMRFGRIPFGAVYEVIAIDWSSQDGSIDFLTKNYLILLRFIVKSVSITLIVLSAMSALQKSLILGELAFKNLNYCRKIFLTI